MSLSFFSWVTNFWSWLGSPVVIPLAGACAAVIVAFTVETRTWLKRPLAGVLRGVRVACLWLLLAWLMGAFAGGGNGSGSAETNAAKDHGQADADAAIRVVEESSPPPGPGAPSVLIRFVESVSDPANAQAFSCDLVATVDGRLQRIEIRAETMKQFEAALRRQLRTVSTPTSGAPVAQIHQTPFPGENVLRRVHEIVEETMPGAAITASPGS